MPTVTKKTSTSAKTVTKKDKKEHARIRFNADEGKWCIMREDGTPDCLFDYAVMENAVFSMQEKKIPGVGCGPSKTDMIGFAEGELLIGRRSISLVGLRSLSFDRASGEFRSNEGAPIKEAKFLYLQPNRHAFYVEKE